MYLSQSSELGKGIPYWLPPIFCSGMPSCLPIVGLVQSWFLVVACGSVEGIKTTLLSVAGVPLQLNGSILHQGS